MPPIIIIIGIFFWNIYKSVAFGITRYHIYRSNYSYSINYFKDVLIFDFKNDLHNNKSMINPPKIKMIKIEESSLMNFIADSWRILGELSLLD